MGLRLQLWHSGNTQKQARSCLPMLLLLQQLSMAQLVQTLLVGLAGAWAARPAHTDDAWSGSCTDRCVVLLCRFVLGHPLVASAVVGASTLQQLQELLEAAGQGPLQDEQLLEGINVIHQQYPNPTP